MEYKKIVLFTGDTETLAYFSRRLAEYFASLGKQVFLFDFEEEMESFLKLTWFLETGTTAMLTFNFIGFCGEDVFIEANGKSIWDNREIPCFNIVVDHPFYYHKFKPLLPKQYVQFSIDRDHETYLKRFFPEIVSGGFLPLAGTEYAAKPPIDVVSANGKTYQEDYGLHWIPYKERKMDIIFTGNYTTTSKLRPYLKEMNEEYEEFYFRIVDDFLEHPHMKMDEGIEKHLWEEVEEINEAGIKECMPNMIFIDLYVRFYFRAKAVRTLVDAGFRVDVFGGGWEYLECEHPENLVVHGPLDSAGCLREISNSRISLNVMPWFKDGAHDRVFNSMLNGAVSVTDSSKYMEEIFTDGENVVFYDLADMNGLVEKVKYLLEHEKEAEEIAGKGQEYARNGHTWKDRGKALDRYISGY
jgi:hypothetical protein